MPTPTNQIEETAQTFADLAQRVRSISETVDETNPEQTNLKLTLQSLGTRLTAPRFSCLAILTYTPEHAEAENIRDRLTLLTTIDAPRRVDHILSLLHHRDFASATDDLDKELKAWSETFLQFPTLQSALHTYHQNPRPLNEQA